jgi:selenocysteine lyase/cysteine desulfurase
MSPIPVYLDNAATSWPKPPAVATAMADFLAGFAGNPGRGGHRFAREAAVPLEACRESLAAMIGAPEAVRVVLTHGCTDAVNQAIHGVLRAAVRCFSAGRPHVVCSSVEHNAVLRTLGCYVETDEIDLTTVGCDGTGLTDPDEFLAACGPRTVLTCLSHASNATGTLQPVGVIGRGLRHRAPMAQFLVDAAQTLGHVPVDVLADEIDLLSIAGHKGLLGPTGTGALYVGPRVWPDDPAERRFFCERRGGTGAIASGLHMPAELPDALEAGTTNAVGFAGLRAAMGCSLPDRHAHEIRMTAMAIDGLTAIPGVTLYGPGAMHGRTPVVLFNARGVPARELACELDARFGVAARGGTHCAPLLHNAIGTGTGGAVRISPGFATTAEELGVFLAGVDALARSGVR